MNTTPEARADINLVPTGRWGASSVALVAVGLGCYLGWRTVDISPTLFPTPAPGVYEALGVWNYIETASFVVLLALCAWLSYARGSLVRRTWLVALTTLGTFAGTALLYLCGWLADPALVPGAIAGRLLYCASAGFVVLWGELLCRLEPSRTLACVAAGYAVSFGVCLLVANLSPGAALAFRGIAPLLSGAALLVVRHDLPPTCGAATARGATEVTAQPRSRTQAGAIPVRLFVGIGLLGAIFVATNHLSETKTEVSTELYTLIAGICISLAILAVALFTRGRSHDFVLLYRLLTPLVIGCLLLTLVLQSGYQRYEALAIGLTWAFFRIFTWTLWAHVGSRDPERGACAFALGHIALTLASTAGEVLCAVVDLASVPLVGAAATIIFVTVVTSALVMDERSVARSLEEQPEGARGASAEAAVPTPENAVAALDLSEREREIALLVAQGLDNAVICEKTCITESTLRTHLRNIYSKLGVHSRTELIEAIRR